MSEKDLTSWKSLIDLIVDAIKNPYVVGLIFVSLWNNIINTNTKGIKDNEGK